MYSEIKKKALIAQKSEEPKNPHSIAGIKESLSCFVLDKIQLIKKAGIAIIVKRYMTLDYHLSTDRKSVV